MIDKITCFKLNWFNCVLCCPELMVQEEITIYRNDNLMVFKELNGYGVICSCEILQIESDKVTTFFDFLERSCDEWENDYKVPVCGGGEWKVRMWHSSHKVKTVCGTIEYPPHGREIENYLRSFLTDSKSLIEPMIFGCS